MLNTLWLSATKDIWKPHVCIYGVCTAIWKLPGSIVGSKYLFIHRVAVYTRSINISAQLFLFLHLDLFCGLAILRERAIYFLLTQKTVLLLVTVLYNSQPSSSLSSLRIRTNVAATSQPGLLS